MIEKIVTNQSYIRHNTLGKSSFIYLASLLLIIIFNYIFTPF